MLIWEDEIEKHKAISDAAEREENRIKALHKADLQFKRYNKWRKRRHMKPITWERWLNP